MNRNHKLSEKTFGARHIAPHMPHDLATKSKYVASGKTRARKSSKKRMEAMYE